MGRQNELLDAALSYAARGWPVLPIYSPAPQGGCSCAHPDCSSPAKHPRIAGGLKAASTDPVAIEAWWRRWPKANVAVRTGAISGLVVIDVDPAHGGKASVAALVQEYGRFPRGPMVTTGGWGWHLYLAHPGRVVRNDAGRRLGPGVDLRGDGGYVIAPPSAHSAGTNYLWRLPPDVLPPVPAWVITRLAPLQPVRPAPPVIRRSRCWSWASAALRAEVERVAAAQVGTRNDTLNRAAFNLGQIVAGGSLDVGFTKATLVAAAASAGLGEREAKATVESGLGAGMHHPRVSRTGMDRQPGHAGASW